MSIKCKLSSNSPPGLLLLTIIIMIKLFISGRKVTLIDRAHRIIFEATQWMTKPNIRLYSIFFFLIKSDNNIVFSW